MKFIFFFESSASSHFARGSTTRQRRAQKKKVVGGRSRGVVRGGAGHPPSEFGQRHLRPIGSVTNEGGKEPMGGARSWNLQRFSPAPPSLSIPEKKKFLSLSLSLLFFFFFVCGTNGQANVSVSVGLLARDGYGGLLLSLSSFFFPLTKNYFKSKSSFVLHCHSRCSKLPPKSKKKPENQNISIVIGIFPTLPFLTVKFVRKKQ